MSTTKDVLKKFLADDSRKPTDLRIRELCAKVRDMKTGYDQIDTIDDTFAPLFKPARPAYTPESGDSTKKSAGCHSTRK